MRGIRVDAPSSYLRIPPLGTSWATRTRVSRESSADCGDFADYGPQYVPYAAEKRGHSTFPGPSSALGWPRGWRVDSRRPGELGLDRRSGCWCGLLSAGARIPPRTPIRGNPLPRPPVRDRNPAPAAAGRAVPDERLGPRPMLGPLEAGAGGTSRPGTRQQKVECPLFWGGCKPVGGRV